MGVYPAATYRPLNQYSNGPMASYMGVVLHVNDSEGASLYEWIAGNNGMSCHFQVAKSGRVEQYIDTRLSSWCQVDGNDTWLSIETEGVPGESFTPAQVTALAELMAWVHREHSIPLVVSDSVTVQGFGWHGMGGANWGGHTACPGDLRKAARRAILDLAAGLTHPSTPVPAPDGEDIEMILITGGGTLRGALTDKGIEQFTGPGWTSICAIRAGLPPARRDALMPYVTLTQADFEAGRVGKATQ